jgi:hypothetical protein
MYKKPIFMGWGSFGAGILLLVSPIAYADITPSPSPSVFNCSADVRMATSVQVNGNTQAAGSTSAGVDGLITFDYAATGELAAPFSKASAGKVGSVWGLAYDSGRKKLYASAFLKRHASYGPNGAGAIYQMNCQPMPASRRGMQMRLPSSGSVPSATSTSVPMAKPCGQSTSSSANWSKWT